MASLSSYFLLAAVALAALFAVGSCGTELTLTIGKDSSSTKLSLITNVAISEVSVKPKGATDFSDDLKESPANTFTLDSKEPIKGPISFRFAAKAGGYRVVDDVIPADFKAGAVYKTGEQVWVMDACALLTHRDYIDLQNKLFRETDGTEQACQKIIFYACFVVGYHEIKYTMFSSRLLLLSYICTLYNIVYVW